MIALGGPKLKPNKSPVPINSEIVSMIALGGPKLKPSNNLLPTLRLHVSMIALGGPKLKHDFQPDDFSSLRSFNDSTGWA